MKNVLIFSMVILFFSLGEIEAAVEEPVSFTDVFMVKNISMENGLSHNFVDDIYADSNGFIWIATSGALGRYDGYEFVNFNPGDPTHSVKSNYVRKITEDRFGHLWVASDEGLDVIDVSSLNPLQPEDTTGLLEKISNSPTGYVSIDNDGNLWVHNNDFIYCFQFNNEGVISAADKYAHNIEGSPRSVVIKPLPCINKGVVAHIGNQLYHLIFNGQRINATPFVNDFSFPEKTYVSDYLCVDDDIWISTHIGLFKYDRLHHEIAEYHAGEKGSLSQNFLTSLALLPGNILAIGSLNGLNIFDPSTNSFVSHKTIDSDSKLSLINHDFINCILVNNGNIWIGTEGAGVNIYSPRHLFAKLLRHKDSDAGSISHNPVNSIYEDNDGTLWIGTVEGGLNRRLPNQNLFSHYTKENGALSHNSVSAITADRKGRLWIGTWGGGLNAIDRKNPGHNLIKTNVTSDGAYQLDYIGALSYDPYNNYIWIGANIGLFVYDPEKEELKLPFPEATQVVSTASAALSPDGVLWLGGESGLFSVDLKNKSGKDGFKLFHQPYKPDDPHSGIREKITCLYFGQDGTLWLGSSGNGVYKREIKNGEEKYVNYTTKDGLPNNIIHGIVDDPQGNIWIATYHGLSCLTPDGKFINFGRHNGLDTEQFYWNASCRLSNGTVMLGSIDGLLRLRGIDPNIGYNSFPVRFTHFKTDEKTENGVLTSSSMHQEEKSFEIGFTALDYVNGMSGRFFYRMKGFDADWKELPSGRNSVNYTNLSPGDYTFQVKYVAPGQSFADVASSEFKLQIVPHFYKQGWFILLTILLLLLIIFGIYWWRIHDLQKQKSKLQISIDKSIQEISEQKKLIEEDAKELYNQNEALKLSNQQISEQKEQLSEMTRQMQRMTAERISFFTNITHEFRTPITLIIGPIERALKLTDNPKVTQQLNYVKRNSKYLLSLVNQLMDFRKMESGKIDIITAEGDIQKFIEDIVLLFRVYGDERKIQINTLFHLSSNTISFDHEAIRKVITNLVGNAIKFTPDGGNIEIYTALLSTATCGNDSMLYLSVKDNGTGIPEGEIEKVFDQFYQGKSQLQYPLVGSGSSGIGLYFCKKLVEVYGGKISVKNNREKGCTFRVLLPVPGRGIKNESDHVSRSEYYLTQEPAKDQEENAMTILIVEDNADMRSYIRSILEDRFNVAEASNGKEALKILLSQDIDFIISDLMMPDIDGLELGRQVKENFSISHIPFVILTAKTDQNSKLDGFKNGVDDYILKPFDEEMLLTRIQNILDNKNRYKQHFIKDMEVEKLNIPTESRDKKFVDQVMEVVHNNYKNAYFDVGDFAEALGVSRSLLNKKLQSLIGESANQLMRSYRMKIAKELILKNRSTRDMNISEIAFSVGFNDSKYFTRCFTKQYGISPSAMLKGETNPVGMEVYTQ